MLKKWIDEWFRGSAVPRFGFRGEGGSNNPIEPEPRNPRNLGTPEPIQSPLPKECS